MPIKKNFCLTIILILFHLPVFSDEIPGWKKKYTPESDTWKTSEQHLIFNNGADPETLDVHLMTGITEFRISGELFEGLATLDPETLEIRPGTAHSWNISNDSQTFTFFIRKEAKWSDGKDLTASDFVLSWKRLLTFDTGASYANLLFHVKGAKKFYENKTQFDTVGVKALNDKTLEITLERPCHYFLDLCAFPVLSPVRSDVMEKYGEKKGTTYQVIEEELFRK